MAKVVQFFLLEYIPEDKLSIGNSQFIPYLGDVFFVQLPTTVPYKEFSIINLVVILLIGIVATTGKRRGHPFSVYIVMVVLVHSVSCIYFLFASKYFPYTASEYSELYMKQEISIWICFAIISGVLTGILGFKGYTRRILTVIGIVGYSFVFGLIRYLLFLYLVNQFSLLYMAVQFFAIGPFFDFLYFVFFYGMYIDASIKRYETDKGRDEWKWA